MDAPASPAQSGDTRCLDLPALCEKAAWVRCETLRLHRRCPETRIASSLSCVELFTALFYSGVLRFHPRDPCWPERDRLVVSKGHGSISLYPVLADLGFFPRAELARVGQEGALLKVIPDPAIPGYETLNGSLGHGLGVGCGMALALRNERPGCRVFVVVGDGELNEGSMWEALMFAGHHRLDNLVLVVDRNGACLLDFCENVLALDPLAEKFRSFGWEASVVDGHDVDALAAVLAAARAGGSGRPRAVVATTVKGKGVARLESDPLSHVRVLTPGEIDVLLGGEA